MMPTGAGNIALVAQQTAFSDHSITGPTTRNLFAGTVTLRHATSLPEAV
jgi:hypothetical protein